MWTPHVRFDPSQPQLTCWRHAYSMLTQYIFSGIKIIQEIPEIDLNFKNSYQFNHSSDWNNLYMKNYQKNAIFPSVLVSCMTNQLIHAVYGKTHYGIYKRLNLELHLSLWFKWTSNQMSTSCISTISITSSCHVHASLCCICLCFDCWPVPSQ